MPAHKEPHLSVNDGGDDFHIFSHSNKIGKGPFYVYKEEIPYMSTNYK